ncbi:MAG: hypothetical protein IJO97_03000 [Lachnospiraceae bacterium]|nr:hypothetical protein [Lachnospiraceae bacterium]
MIKKIVISLSVILSIVALYMLGSGFRRDTSAYIGEYSVSEDETMMNVEVGVGSSIGAIRKVVINHETDGVMCLDLYSAFGGLNGSIGAKSSYQIPVSEDTHTICVYQGNGRYESVLVKDENGNWVRLDFDERKEYN